MPLPADIKIHFRRVDGSMLVIDDAAALAEAFFATEVSSLGASSYDARTLTTHPDQVDREDIHVLNASFRAMIMRTQLWQPLIDTGDLPWLVALGRDWDLLAMPNEQWHGEQVGDCLEGAIGEIIAVKGRGPAQATKLLHLKRPALVPVIDSLVVKALRAQLSDEPSAPRAKQCRAILEHLRLAGSESLSGLELIRQHLVGVGIKRSLVRILDALLWCSQAAPWIEMSHVIARWRSSTAPWRT